MKKVNKHILFLVLALLAIPTTAVFAKELGLLTISGPGIKGELSLDNHDDIMNLEQSGFFDQATLAKPPQNLDFDKGYTITAHLNLDGKLVPFVQMVYYPTAEGQSSYVHYTGRLDGETLQTVDEWGVLNRQADGLLRELMTANNVTVQSALVKAPEAVAPAQEPVSVPAVEPAAVTAPSPAPASYLIPALVVGLLALVGAAIAIRRRTVSHPTT